MLRVLFSAALIAVVAMPAIAQQSPNTKRAEFRWDLLLRYDSIEDIPSRIPVSFERTRVQVRPGFLLYPTSTTTVEVRLAGYADTRENDELPLADGSSKQFQIGSQDHLTFTGRQDNFRPNSIALDRLNIRLRPTENVEVVAGKFQNPLDTTEATWDIDLQPEGVAGTYILGDTASAHSRISAVGYFGTQLYGDQSRILGGQYTFSTGEASTTVFSASATYLNYSDLDELGRKNWRQNRTIVTNGIRAFASDFEIADVLLRLRCDRWIPLAMHVDVIRNLGASDDGERDGLEAGVRIGELGGAGSYRVSYVYQDLDRDAVMDGFNGDDWYLHSWYRGSLVRAAVGVGRGFALQGTYVEANHHQTTYPTERLMLDLIKRF